MSVSSDEGKRGDLRQRLEEWPDEAPRSWRPNIGSVLVGRVIRYDRAESSYGPCWVCVVEEPESGDFITIWLSATVLMAEFKRKKPTPGEMIGVKRPSVVEKHYERFRLIVVARETAEGIPDFDESPPGDVPPGEPPAPTDDTMAFSSEALSREGSLSF
jgi:hypothetical protein